MTVLFQFVLFYKCDHFVVTSHTKSSQLMVVCFESVFFPLTSCHLHSFTMKRRLRNTLRSKLFLYYIISFSVECCVIEVFLHRYLGIPFDAQQNVVLLKIQETFW